MIPEEVKRFLIDHIDSIAELEAVLFLREHRDEAGLAARWHMTSDRLFLYFSPAYFLEALGRLLIGLSAVSSDEHPVIYLIRVVAYGLIIFAIVNKNRKTSPSAVPPDKRFQKA